MQTKDLPADEICLQACVIMLKIHISVDYTTGCWTTFETSNTNHEYLTELSDIHLMYRGACKYNLLCRTGDLKTIGRKLLDHKLYNIELIKPVRIILTRIEDWPDKTENATQATYDSDTTELYYAPGSLTPLDLMTNKPTESDTTEIYELSTDDESKTKQEDTKEHNLNESGYTSNDNPISDENNKTVHKKQLFKCKIKKCAMKSNSKKELYQHHKVTHRGVNKCTTCHKKYRTPYSLQQHNYIHRRSSQLWNCSKCKMSFAFKSQLMIHKISHTKHGKFECMECFTNFKFKHDMYRHQREHTAITLSCKKCDYTGTLLNLKEHERQHFKRYNKTCPLCKQTFNFRMSFWHHRKRCHRSDSPDF